MTDPLSHDSYYRFPGEPTTQQWRDIYGGTPPFLSPSNLPTQTQNDPFEDILNMSLPTPATATAHNLPSHHTNTSSHSSNSNSGTIQPGSPTSHIHPVQQLQDYPILMFNPPVRSTPHHSTTIAFQHNSPVNQTSPLSFKT